MENFQEAIKYLRDEAYQLSQQDRKEQAADLLAAAATLEEVEATPEKGPVYNIPTAPAEQHAWITKQARLHHKCFPGLPEGYTHDDVDKLCQWGEEADDFLFGISRLVATQPAPLDIPHIKQALKTLSFEDRVSLCEEQGIHFAYLEAVLSQPGSQQSSFSIGAFKQLVERAATRWPQLALHTAAPTELLDLPALHARLLPLVQAASHEKLLLSVAIGDGLPCYEADATGGPSGFRRYISRFDYGDTPSQFEARLTELLQQQATYRTTTQPTSYASH